MGQVVIIAGLEGLFRDALVAALSRLNWVVNDPVSGCAERSGRQPDLAIVLAGPQVDSSLEVVRTVRAKYISAKLVVVGNGYQDTEVLRLIQEGAAAYVDSRRMLNDLLITMDMVIGNRSDCSPRLCGLVWGSIGNMTRGSLGGSSLLTKREREVFRLIAEGMRNKDIAQRLAIAVATVKHHVHHVLQKLDASSRQQVLGLEKHLPYGIQVERWNSNAKRPSGVR